MPQNQELIDEIRRPTKSKDQQLSLFDTDNTWWKSLWWGMPSYEIGDATPSYQIIVNFYTREDLYQFAKRLEVPITEMTKSINFPYQPPTDMTKWAYVDDTA